MFKLCMYQSHELDSILSKFVICSSYYATRYREICCLFDILFHPLSDCYISNNSLISSPMHEIYKLRH